MAEPARPVNVVGIAGIDPDLQSVGIFRSGLPAPGKLPLPLHLQIEHQPFVIPGRFQNSEERASLQFSKGGKYMAIGQVRSPIRPQVGGRQTRNGVAEEKRGGE